MGPRIALIHAVYAAMAPAEAAFKTQCPQAQRVNLIDDALPADLERDGHMAETMRLRIRRLADAGALFHVNGAGCAAHPLPANQMKRSWAPR